MKRAAPSAKASPKAKKLRGDVPEYHLAASVKDEGGNIIWPAPESQIKNARKFIQEWSVFPHFIATRSLPCNRVQMVLVETG